MTNTSIHYQLSSSLVSSLFWLRVSKNTLIFVTHACTSFAACHAAWVCWNISFINRSCYIIHCHLWIWQVLIANIEEYAPIVYTPTVGLVCQNYSGLFRRPRGMYFSAEDRGEMMSMVYNWPADQVFNLLQWPNQL